MATLFSDSFTRADGDSLGADWVERLNDFDISGNKVVTSGALDQNGHFYHGTAAYGTADYAVQCTYQGRPLGGDFGGIVGRRVNRLATDHEGYGAFINTADGDVYLFRYAGGSYTQLDQGAATFADSTDITLRLEMQGTSIRVLADGVEYCAVTDAGLSAEGDSGGTNYGLSWDNWLVEDFASGTSGDITAASESHAAAVGTLRVTGSSAAATESHADATGTLRITGTVDASTESGAAAAGSSRLTGTAAAASETYADASVATPPIEGTLAASSETGATAQGALRITGTLEASTESGAAAAGTQRLTGTAAAASESLSDAEAVLRLIAEVTAAMETGAAATANPLGTPGPHPLSVEFTPISRSVEFTAITRTVEFTPITRTVEFTDG